MWEILFSYLFFHHKCNQTLEKGPREAEQGPVQPALTWSCFEQKVRLHNLWKSNQHNSMNVDTDSQQNSVDIVQKV